jgi:hypothetical protein
MTAENHGRPPSERADRFCRNVSADLKLKGEEFPAAWAGDFQAMPCHHL